MADIVALDIHGYVAQDLAFGLVNGIIPMIFWNEMCPVLCGKAAVHAWCDACADHGSFDWKSSTAAKWVNQNTVFFQGVNRISAAAKVSVIGALTVARR